MDLIKEVFFTKIYLEFFGRRRRVVVVFHV